jgi:hypothetical protein
MQDVAYHFSRLRAANRELEIGIFLPVSEKEGELVEEAVVDVAHELDGRGTRVAGYAAFEVGCAADEALPPVIVVFVLNLLLIR